MLDKSHLKLLQFDSARYGITIKLTYAPPEFVCRAEEQQGDNFKEVL